MPVKVVQLKVSRKRPESLGPIVYSAFVFATQIARDVQLDLCTMDLMDLHNAMQERKDKGGSEDEALEVEVKVYHSAMIPEDAARVLHDVLSKAIANWDGANLPADKEGG